MRKRVAFRALIILVASALLLTSTGAYNILVFADQNMELSSLSATDEGEASAPSVATYGGELITEAAEMEALELATQSADDPFGNHAGTYADPYPLNQDNFLAACDRISNSAIAQTKYFQLTGDINISNLTISNFHHSAVNSAAYLFSAEGSNPSAVNFVIDGLYEDPDNAGNYLRHRIYSNSNTVLDASGYRYFALFGFMNENCQVKNIIIENINVNLMNAASCSLVAFKNKGVIQNVTVNNCSMTVTGSTANTDWNAAGQQYSHFDNIGNTGNEIYPGFAAVAADNCGDVSTVSVENYRLSVSNASAYLGGVVAQNRGTSLSGSTVNGLKITATASNAYVGGICAYNAASSTVANSTVNLPGLYHDNTLDIDKDYGGEIYGGRYVGGLVGRNDGTLTNSLIEGSFGTVSTPSAEAYDMCGVVRSDDNENAVSYFYGGAVAGGSGTVSRVTVQNLGFYMSLVSTEQPCYFGGITATASAQNSVVGCVSTGSFASSAYSPVCHAGGVIAYAPANAAAGTLSNCYTLFRLQNKGHYLTGAVIGFGGTATMASNCYWSSEISGCVTAYAIPNTSDSSIIETISDRSLDLSAVDSNDDPLRATVARRNVTLSGLEEPIHSWGGGASFSHTNTISGEHLVQGVINSLDAVSYQQTLSLANANNIGYSGRTSIVVDFKLDVFIVTADDVGDPNDPTDPLQISSSGMTRFLYLAPYANYVLTQDVTIDDYEWEPVAFSGQLSGFYNNATHSIYAPCRLFTAVVGSRAAGAVTVDTATNTTSLTITNNNTRLINGGYIYQLGVTMTPDYFVLGTGASNKSVFGSLFGATMCSVALVNDTDQSAKLTGTRQGVFADAAYDNTYLYGCSTDVSLTCSGTCTDVGAFLGYIDPSANVVDNCVVDADVTLTSGATAANVGAFIGNIGLANNTSSSYVLNSIVVTTVSDGVASVFGFAPDGATVAARRFHNIFWARNSQTEESAPIVGTRDSYDGLVLWGTTNNDQTDPQYYTCNHTLNSGDAVVSLPLPQNISQIHITSVNQAKSEFSVTRIPDAEETYSDPEIKFANGNLVLSFIPVAGVQHNDSDVFKVTHQKTGLCTYVVITALTAGGMECDEDGYYMIKTAADLKNLSDDVARGDNAMATSAFKLYADIDMSYFDGSDIISRTFWPIGGISQTSSTVPFAGVFVGATNPDTGEPYTISHVTVMADNNEKDQVNNGLFGVVNATMDETTYMDDEGNYLTKTCEIGGFNLEDIRVVGGDHAGTLIGSLLRNTNVADDMYEYPIHDICVTNSSVTGGKLGQDDSGSRVGGLIGEVDSNSVALSGITMEHVEVTTNFYDLWFSNRVASNVNNSEYGYFTSDYFLDHRGIGGVIGAAYSEPNNSYPATNATTISVTDTHVLDVFVAGSTDMDDIRSYAMMDAGGIIGSVMNSYKVVDPETSLVIGDPNVTGDVTVVDSQVKAYGNTGGVIGFANVPSVLTNCVVRGSSSAVAPERSAMTVFSRTLYYVGGIAGYIGVSTNMAGDLAIKPSNEIYASFSDCLVENAYVASTETTYTGKTVEAGNFAPMRNVSVGGIIGGGNGQGYAGTESAPEDEELLPFVSGCTVSHSRIEGIVTGGIVGADAEIQYTPNDVTDSHLTDPTDLVLDDELLNFRDYITHCDVTNSTITTVSNATRIAGDFPSVGSDANTVGGAECFIIASGVGGIMGSNARFHYDGFGSFAKQVVSYGYMHDTVIEYCTVDGRSTVESLLPFTETTTNCTVAAGGVIGTAFTNCTRNIYEVAGQCVLRFNEIDASVYNSASYPVASLDQNTQTEPEIKVGTGGFIGAVKGGANQYDGQTAVLCYVPGIHVYTSVFSGRVSGDRLLGGAIGLVNYASDYDYYGGNYSTWGGGTDPADAVENGEVPSQMLYNLALAGTVSLSGPAEAYTGANGSKCYGGYVIGHISADDGFAFTFDDYSEYHNDPSLIVSDVTYSSLGGDNSHFVAFGFFTNDVDDAGSPPFADFTDCYRDVNLDEYGDPLFDDIPATDQIFHFDDIYIPVTEGDSDSFVIMDEYDGDNDGVDDYGWRGSDDSVALVVSSCVTHNSVYSKRASVTAQRRGVVTISIPFVGTLTDYSGSGEWDEKVVFVFCGFRYESPVQARLSIATNTSNGDQFHLVQTPYDMSMVGYDYDFTFNGLFTGINKKPDAMDWSYALFNPAGEIAFSEDMFAADGSFPGGLTPVGTTSTPFTGTFLSLPAGTYTIADYDISDTNQNAVGTRHDFTENVTADHVSINASSDTVTITSGFRVTLRNVKVSAASGIGASLFGVVSGGVFQNFDIDGMTLTGTTSGNYLGAIASKAIAPATSGVSPISISGVNLNNFDFSDADYIGGLVGGVFANHIDPSANDEPAAIDECVVGTPDSDNLRSNFYSNTIVANIGAGGLVAHSSQYGIDLCDCEVRDVDIEQVGDVEDVVNLDNGAAGVVMAYAGAMEDVVVEHCFIMGEVVGGAVMRSYTSAEEDNFSSAGTYGNYSGTTDAVTCSSAESVSLTGIEIRDSELLGTIDVQHDTESEVNGFTVSAAPYSASGGILARVDANTSAHTITDCSVDAKTTVQAVDAVGGIVGCFESPYGQDVGFDTDIYLAEFGVTITDCSMNATLSRTAESSDADEYTFNRGVGGVIGILYRFSPLTFTQISGCSVGGVIRADNTAGGIVGSLLTDRLDDVRFSEQMGSNVPSYLNFVNMAADTHFVSNCLITTNFVKRVNNADVSPFATRALGIGVILGYNVTDLAYYPDGVVVVSTDGYYDTDNNYPFYHVMFSSANYSEDYVSLFGFDDDQASNALLNGMENATKYCYDLNCTSSDPANETTHFTVGDENEQNAGCLIPASRSRINAENPNEAGSYELFDSYFNSNNANTVTFSWGSDLPSDVKELVFDTHTTNGAENDPVTYEDYTFDSSATPYTFTTTSGSAPSDDEEGEKDFSFELTSVELANGTNSFELAYPVGQTESESGDVQSFTLTLKENANLNEATDLTIIFTYDNGLKMSLTVFINVHAKEYWRLDPDVSGLDYTYFLVFNAADLAALQTQLSSDDDARANARIIQCYDVFWTVSDSGVITAAKAALKNEYDEPFTISEVLGDYFDEIPLGYDENGDEEILELSAVIGDFVRPNPAYDPNDSESMEPEEISFYDYFNSGNFYDDYPSLDEVPMEFLVGDIGQLDYGVYGETGCATIIDPYDAVNEESVPFTGKYIVLKNTLERFDPESGDPVSTGVTEYEECFGIYGLDLRSENTVANSSAGVPYAGLIAQLGPYAVVDGVRFINPKISVINSDGTPCSAGVLAGVSRYTTDDYDDADGNDEPDGMPLIRNISIIGDGSGDSHVKAITRMNAASVSAGGLIGEIYGSADIYNASVFGLDVVASYMANAGANTSVSILTGGIAGKAAGFAIEPNDPMDEPIFLTANLRNTDVADSYVIGGHKANPVGDIKSYGGGMFGIMNASVDMLDEDPVTGDPITDGLSEVSGTVVGGSYITTAEYIYDRTNQNNTAMDIAGGVAALSTGVSTVNYVNVIGSTIVGGDISGGIVGQVADKASGDPITRLTVTNSGVGVQKGFDPNDPYTLVVLSEAHPTSVLVVGTSGSADRFNTAGGVVGNVQNLDNLYIGSINDGEKGVDFKGVVGTYSCDNHNREATAGGIIGSISDSDEFTAADYDNYLDRIQIYDSTVQGEINGFNRENVTGMKCAGSAGGIVGKIAFAAHKDIDYVGDGNLFISSCIMSAKVNLYTSVYGVTVDCADNQRNRRRDTNVGKLIGRVDDGALIDEDCDPIVVGDDFWALIYHALVDETGELVYYSTGSGIDDPAEALNAALRGDLVFTTISTGISYRLSDQYCAITDYIQNVLGSSYPQDIVLYGNHNLCGIDFELYADPQSMSGVELPYIDCNQTYRYIVDTEVEYQSQTLSGADFATLPMEMQSFMVSEGVPSSGDIDTDNPTYTTNAFIQYQNASVSEDKYFRFMNPQNRLTFLANQIDILDSHGEKISEATASYSGQTKDEYVDLYNSAALPDNPYIDSRTYTYDVGIMTIDLPGEEMVGSIVLNFAYGIQMNSSFTSIQINGSGTEQDPYQIARPKHFYVMRALHSSDTTYFKQVNNINLNMLDDPDHNVLNRYTTLEGFEPIGTPVSPFVGHFDGDGYVIQNLYINDEASGASGLFGCVGRNADLSNIHVEIADSLIIQDVDDQRTLVNGGIIGGNNTGGLIGMVKTTGSSNTTVTNCSVANGNIVGGLNVGGLVGSSAGSATIRNCFTSTTTASYAGTANVGALLGAVSSGSCTLADCYTAGLAVAGSASPVETAAGGLVGRNSSACQLNLSNCFVGATASGNTASSIGLAVAANDGTIAAASGNTVAVLMPRENKGKDEIFVIAPGYSSSANNSYESKMIGAGIIDSTDHTAPIDYTNTSYDEVTDYQSRIASYNNGSDAYSEAYRKLIAAAVKVDQSQNTSGVNQIQTENIILNGGLLYPLTMTFDTATVFTTSVYDMSDTVEYPLGIDLDLTGNGSNKNTDLLFRTRNETVVENNVSTTNYTTTIYRNIFRSNDANAQIVKYDGETYANGEVYYDYEMPYAVAAQTVTVGGETVEIARKVMYPVASIEPLTMNGTTSGSKIFPIATARQLKALTSTNDDEGTKFGFLCSDSGTSNMLDYQVRKLLLVADIDLASTVFTPLELDSNAFYGNGHVISNLQVNKHAGSAAMFASVTNGGVYDLGLMGVNVVNSVTAETAAGGETAAMLVGYLDRSTVSNCFAIGSVEATNMRSGISIGGLVASASGTSAASSTIENSMVSGTVSGYISNGGAAAGLLGKASGTVEINNVTITNNVDAYETYAICGSVSNGSNVTVVNAVYGGQMTNEVVADEPRGVAARQYLVPVNSSNVPAASVTNVCVDNGLGLLIPASHLQYEVALGNPVVYAKVVPTAALASSAFVTDAITPPFVNNGMTSFGDGYYPVATAYDVGTTNAFKAGARFAAAAIQLNYVVSTDAVSSVSAPDALGTYGTAGLSADTSLGAYVNTEGGLLTINPLSMRLTQKVEEAPGVYHYEAAPEVSGVTGSVYYSLLSPLANNYLVRTVDGVKVQKLFTLNYEISNASGSTAYSGDDRAVITVENVVNSNNMSTTGLAGTPAGETNTPVTAGTICENMMIQAQNGYYSLQAYCQPGSVGDTVNSVTVHPAYLENGNVVVDTSISISTDPNDPSVSSFSATSTALGQAEDSGRRFAYLVVVVEMASPDASDWGLQRVGGNWIYIPSNP